ncbi:MAG: polysaccharide biosynthesis C-terminal domain-containing protein [Ruminococcus sp.]|nr:polysaccharide biosynthesis C-terminal domain-containing protein [Ruminococcus sp.]
MKKQSFLKGSAILVGMVIVTKALGLAYKVPLANILGGTGMGWFMTAFSLFTPVFALSVSGIPSAMARLAAENAALGRYANLRRQKHTAFLVYSLMGLAACGAVVGLATLSDSLPLGNTGVRYSLYCLAPSVLFCAVMNVERGYCEGMGNMLPTALSEIAETVFKLGLGLGLALYVRQKAAAGFAADGMVFGTYCADAETAEKAALPYIAAAAVLGSTLASGLACMLLLIGCKLRGDGITSSMLKSDPVKDSVRRHTASLLRLSGAISMAAVVTTLTGMIDMLTVSPCIRAAMERVPQRFEKFSDIPPEQLPTFLYGSYEGLAVMIYGLVPTLTAMLGKSALPPLAEHWTKGDTCAFRLDLQRLLMLASSAAMPAGLGICALSGELLRFLFAGRETEIAAALHPLEILGVSVIFFGIALPCFTVLQTVGKPSRVTFIMLMSGMVKLALNLLLIPFLGMEGAALSELVSCIFVLAAALHSVLKLSGGIRAVPIFVKPFYAGMMCAVSAKLCSGFLNRAFSAYPHRFLTVIAVIFGGIMYFISMYLLCEMPKNALNYVFLKKSEKST